MLKIIRQARFFDLFEKQSDLILKCADALHELIYDFGDAPAKAARIKDLEHQADLVTHEVVQSLNTTFITPLDREDIHALATRLDDVLDFMEACAERLVLYHIRQPTSACRAFADLIVQIVKPMDDAIRSMRGQHDEFHAFAVEVNRLENVADNLLRDSLVALFEETPEPMEVIKWKEIYELLEIVTDRCEDVVNVIEVILLKAA